MSSESLVEGPSAVLAGWETAGQVFFGKIDPATLKLSQPIPAPGAGQGRKHPALAVNTSGETLFVWTEGTGWERGGSLAWQVFDKNDRPTEEKGRVSGGVPVWGLATAVSRRDGGFTVIH
jgi:hypothetical protein